MSKPRIYLKQISVETPLLDQMFPMLHPDVKREICELKGTIYQLSRQAERMQEKLDKLTGRLMEP